MTSTIHPLQPNEPHENFIFFQKCHLSYFFFSGLRLRLEVEMILLNLEKKKILFQTFKKHSQTAMLRQ